MDRLRVGIVIPALNEALTIGGVVKEVSQFGIPIVVDDGSTDATAQLALESGAVIVRHSENCGYDSALNSGFLKARQLGVMIIITLDSDGQHNPSIIQNFIACIELGADVVVGLRDHRQRFSEHLFAWYSALRFRVRDPLCGFKAYRADVYSALGFFDSYGSVGTELLFFAVKSGYSIEQIPFIVQKRHGESKFGKMLSGNYKIIRAIFLSLLRS